MTSFRNRQLDFLLDLMADYNGHGDLDLSKINAELLFDADSACSPGKPWRGDFANEAIYLTDDRYTMLAGLVRDRDEAAIGRFILDHLDMAARQMAQDQSDAYEEKMHEDRIELGRQLMETGE